jgi:hypothetical protein
MKFIVMKHRKVLAAYYLGIAKNVIDHHHLLSCPPSSPFPAAPAESDNVI